MGSRARMEPAAREMVRRREDQRERELPGSPPARRPPQQGGDHLGRRAGRHADADLSRPASRGVAVRERPQVAGRHERRSRRPLPAADSRARDCDARLRAHRGDPQRRLRRLQRGVAARSHQRSESAAARHRRRRLPARPGRGAEESGRRGADRRAIHRTRGGRPPRRRRPRRRIRSRSRWPRRAITGTTS